MKNNEFIEKDFTGFGRMSGGCKTTGDILEGERVNIGLCLNELQTKNYTLLDRRTPRYLTAASISICN